MNPNQNIWLQRRKRISEIIAVGQCSDWPSRSYDIVSSIILLLNITVTVMYTFDEMECRCGGLLLTLEAVTVAFFAVDYFLRVWTARFAWPSPQGRRCSVCSGWSASSACSRSTLITTP